MKWIPSSLRARLIGLVLLAVIPAFCVILFTDQRYRASITTQVQKNTLGSVRVIANEQRRIIDNAHQLLITLARLPQIREKNSAACSKILTGLLEPLYVDIGVIDLNGNLLCNAIGPSPYRNLRMKNSYIRRVVDTQDFLVGEIEKDDSHGKTVVQLGFPVSDSPGSIRAVVYLFLDYSWIVRITAENHLPSDATFKLFDTNGRVFLRYPADKDSGAPDAKRGLSDNGKIIRGVEGHINSLGVDQVPRVITYRQLDQRMAGNIMYAGIDIPARSAFAETERILRQNLIVLSVLAILTSIAAWFGADLFVLRKVDDLMRATRQLAAGNLKARTGLAYGGSELDQLARTFDDLAKALEQRAAEAKVTETEIQKQHLRQAAIHEISTAMTSSLDVNNVMQALWEGVASVFPSSYVTLSWVGDKAELEALAHPESPERKDLWLRAQGERGLPQEVFKIGAPLLIANVQHDPRSSDPASLVDAGFITYLGLPMKVKDEILGVLSFYSTEAIDLRTEEEDFLTDLTHQAAIAIYNSRLYEQTRNQTAELEKSNRIKDEFLGVISHELRTPLNIIMNCAEALKMGVFGEITTEHEKGTEKIRVQASHLLSLINGILEITKIETDVIAINTEEIDLYKLVAELETDYAMVVKDNSVTVNWLIPNDLPEIVSDRMKLRQVVINLVNNAIKFTDQGTVDISLRHVVDKSMLEFSVSDTGIGIAEEFLPHIFDKFRQIDSTTTRHYSGAGLGLYLVRNFVKILGGSVSVRSTLGQGTTFTVRLPVDCSSVVPENEAIIRGDSANLLASERRVEGVLG